MENWPTCEKLSIRESAKTLKKYGSTSKHVSRNQNFVKHFVTTSDTLQGIALKYGVTMEQIRRANRLWATDSLFLREYLLIPASDNCELPSSQEQNLVNNHQEISSPPSSFEDVYSFLVKIDNSVANTKKEVKKSRRNSEFAPSLESNCDSERKKPPVSRMKQSTNNNSEEILTAPQAVIMSTSRGRILRSSLQKLEQEQDELFEL